MLIPEGVRVTPDNSNVSVIDVIRIVCFTRSNGQMQSASGQKNASDYLKFLFNAAGAKWNPDGKYKFKGQGQRPTPIVATDRLPQLIRILVCKMRRSLRWKRATLEKYGCDCADLDLEWRMFVESEIMPHLLKAFAACSPKPQFACGPYRIDLYLPLPKIAVECDELGHGGYKKEAELRRERFITESLDCRFVRFNPHCSNFDVMDVVGLIVRAMTIEAKP